MYNNYHKHDYYGNPWSVDSYIKPEEYCLRAKELGHKTIFTTNHGVTGNIFEYLELAQKYNLKMCYGFEGYLVKNRFKKEDRKNKHIIIIAKNDDGVKQLNDIMSESFSTGFYYKPRIDLELLFSLNPENFVITTACVAGIWDDAELIIALKNKFKNNFFLEVQTHNLDIQKKVNERILTLSKLENIPLIHANDSHYIYPEDKKYRDIFLRGKNIIYENFEDEMILDYPSEDEIFERYKKQGILSPEQVQEALQNTLIFDECEPITLINDDIKLPSVSSQPMEDLKTIIRKQWLIERKNIPKELWKKYTDAILYELDIVEKTNMANYFLIDYKVAKDAQEKYNGRLTNTGRGCFEGNCYVHTLNGIKQLKDVIIGDKVLTYDGTFQNVLNTMKYDIEEELVEIKHLYGSVKGHNPICTKDHKILVRRNEKNQWIEAQDILPTDYVCVPKIEFSESIPTTIDLNQYNIYGFRFDNNYIYEEYNKGNVRYNKKIKRFININEDFNTFIGLMYGDGFTNSAKQCEIGLALNTQNHKYTDNYFYFKSVANQLGLSIRENKNQQKHLSQIYMHSKVFTNFIKTELFESKKNKNKDFNPKWFEQSKKNLLALLKGLYLSDGSKEQLRYSFDNTSPSIINAYKLLCLATETGVPSMSVRNPHIDSRGFTSKQSYKLRINPNSRNARKICERTLEDNEYFYLPVKGIIVRPKRKTTVYDLSIENNHNYVINNMTVHNSAPSFYITKLLGLTDIDRVSSPITLFPTRFMSAERILGTRSLPD